MLEPLANPHTIIMAMAYLHALIITSFGVSLVYSGLLGLQNPSVNYRFITAIPGWPETVGGAFALLGVWQLYACWRSKPGALALSFAAVSLTMGLYAAAYAVGTATAPDQRTVIGPQITYLALSVVYGLHSGYSAVRWLNDRRP